MVNIVNLHLGDGKSKTNAYCLIYHRVDGKISKSGHYPNYGDRLG